MLTFFSSTITDDARKSRSARRRLRQREKQREMKRSQQQSGDSSKASSSGDSPAKPGNNPDKTGNPQQQQTAGDKGYNKPRRTPSPRKNYGGGDSYQRQGQGQDRRRSPEKGRPMSPDKKPQQVLAKNEAVNHDTQAEQQSTDTPVQKAPSDNGPAQKPVVDSKAVQDSGDIHTKMNGDINEAMPADENALPQRKPRNRGDRKAESIVNGEAEHLVICVVNGVNGLLEYINFSVVCFVTTCVFFVGLWYMKIVLYVSLHYVFFPAFGCLS